MNVLGIGHVTLISVRANLSDAAIWDAARNPVQKQPENERTPPKDGQS